MLMRLGGGEGAPGGQGGLLDPLLGGQGVGGSEGMSSLTRFVMTEGLV